MEKFSVTLPVSTGIVAAVIFLFFEIIIFPCTMYATSKCAILSLEKRLKKGKSVVLKSISFPVWNDGLLERQTTHRLLLILRMLIMLIPLYLETRISSMELPLVENVFLPEFFEVNPVTDLAHYRNFSRDGTSVGTSTLRNIALTVLERCTKYVKDGWVVASIANLTYLNDGYINRISCLRGTEKRIFRYAWNYLEHETDEWRLSTLSPAPSHSIFNVSANISILIGDRELFPIYPDPYNQGPLSDVRPYFRVESIDVLAHRGFECFGNKGIFAFRRRHDPFDWCQKKNGNFVEFWFPDEFSESLDFSTANIVRQFKKGIIQQVSLIFNISELYSVGTFEFPGSPTFTAEHVINIDSQGVLHVLRGNFEDGIRRILYTRRENRTITITLDKTKSVTTLDGIFVMLLNLELLLVVTFWMSMFFISKMKSRLQEIPASLNGLSRCWARAHCCDSSKEEQFASLPSWSLFGTD